MSNTSNRFDHVRSVGSKKNKKTIRSEFFSLTAKNKPCKVNNKLSHINYIDDAE